MYTSTLLSLKRMHTLLSLLLLRAYARGHARGHARRHARNTVLSLDSKGDEICAGAQVTATNSRAQTRQLHSVGAGKYSGLNAHATCEQALNNTRTRRIHPRTRARSTAPLLMPRVCVCVPSLEHTHIQVQPG